MKVVTALAGMTHYAIAVTRTIHLLHAKGIHVIISDHGCVLAHEKYTRFGNVFGKK